MKTNLFERIIINLKKLKIILTNNFGSRFFYDKKVNKMDIYFKDKKGIRIGGKLSWKFNKFIKKSEKIVDVNISEEYVNKKNKIDYLTDATKLDFAKNGEFDFVCSSHVLEHISNPIKALNEWIRVIKRGGVIYCGVPDKRFTFDSKRKKTDLNHLISDFKKDIKEHDNSHVQDFVDNINIKKCAYNKTQFIKNLKTNPYIYTHYHVWTKEYLIKLFEYIRLEIIFVDIVGNTIHIIGKKIK